MRTISTASAHLQDSDYLTRINTGVHEFLADEPEAAGGKNAGPSPDDYLLAALASCTLITLRMYAQRKGWTLGALDVQVTLKKDDEKRTHIERELSVSAELSDEQWQKLLEIAAKTPVTLTLSQGATITTRRGP